MVAERHMGVRTDGCPVPPRAILAHGHHIARFRAPARLRQRDRARPAGQPPVSGLTAIVIWQFTKYGVVTTVVTVAVAWGCVWLRYFS
jgi:hypothetical protein